MRYPDGTEVRYQYNIKGYLTKETDALGDAYRTIESVAKRNGGHYVSRVKYRNNLATETTALAGGSISAICTQLYSDTCGTNIVQHIRYDT